MISDIVTDDVNRFESSPDYIPVLFGRVVKCWYCQTVNRAAGAICESCNGWLGQGAVLVGIIGDKNIFRG